MAKYEKRYRSTEREQLEKYEADFLRRYSGMPYDGKTEIFQDKDGTYVLVCSHWGSD